MSSEPELEIISRRVIDAPRELVYLAWTDPKYLAEWWGPNGFRNTFHEHDPRPGGNWIFTMHGPDGKNYPNESVYLELVKPEEQAGKTLVTFRMRFETQEERTKVLGFVPAANEQNFDRLEAELAKMR